MKSTRLFILLVLVLAAVLALAACDIFAPEDTTTAPATSVVPVTSVVFGDFSEGLDYTLSADGTYYTVSGIGTCQDTDIKIPGQHLGKPVKEIGDGAFENCESLTSVTIPDSVTSIGYRAFYQTPYLGDI